MKVAQIQEAVMGGQVLAVGEFRDWEAKEFASPGKPPMVITTTYVLHGRDVWQVRAFVDKSVPLSACVPPPWKPGQLLAVRLSSLEQTKWGVRVMGTCEPLGKD